VLFESLLTVRTTDRQEKSTHPLTHCFIQLLDNEIGWSSCNVVFGGVVFAEVVSFVLFAEAPVDKEVSLLDSVSDPVKSHVNCLGWSLFYCV